MIVDRQLTKLKNEEEKIYYRYGSHYSLAYSHIIKQHYVCLSDSMSLDTQGISLGKPFKLKKKNSLFVRTGLFLEYSDVVSWQLGSFFNTECLYWRLAN